jgi:hypothetical protein
MGTLRQALSNARTSEWVKWVCTSENACAKETAAFLERALEGLPANSRDHCVRRLKGGDEHEVDARLHELLIHEITRHAGWRPLYQPRIENKTPDLLLQIDGLDYLADVFVTKRPEKTRFVQGSCHGYVDSGEAAKKLADRVAEKAQAYGSLQKPLILFAIFQEHAVGHRDLEGALYGDTIAEIGSTGGLTDMCHEDWHPHGVFCPPGFAANYPWLSAVIGCDWFDTRARDRPGRRLHCFVYNHWQPRVSVGAQLGRFPEVRWSYADHRWIPTIHGQPNLVMSTDSVDPVWAPYTSDEPW